MAMAFAAKPPPTREQRTADPNDPTTTRRLIPGQEREALGLKLHTWTGTVDPEVYARLDSLNKMMEKMEERLKTERDEEAFNTLRGMRFPGTVYVQVHLKEAEARHRVLANLNASDFQAPFPFEQVPGLTGYVTKKGLDKLAKNPDVTGVCLDDKPLVTRGATIVKQSFRNVELEEAIATRPGVAEGKVDPDVYRAFRIRGRVNVLVHLRMGSLPELKGTPAEMRNQWQKRLKAERQLQDEVLATVNAHDFWLWSRIGRDVSADVTQEGLYKLIQHPHVVRVYLPELRQMMSGIEK